MGQLTTRKLKRRLGAGLKKGENREYFLKEGKNEKSLFYAGLRDYFG